MTMAVKRTWRLQAWERQAIVDAYAGGEKLDAIAAEFGCCRHYPRVLASRRGQPARGKGSQLLKPVLVPNSAD